MERFFCALARMKFKGASLVRVLFVPLMLFYVSPASAVFYHILFVLGSIFLFAAFRLHPVIGYFFAWIVFCSFFYAQYRDSKNNPPAV